MASIFYFRYLDKKLYYKIAKTGLRYNYFCKVGHI